MSNLAKAFVNGRAFIAFIPCGDPDLSTTAAAVRAAAAAGADLIELGIPFSDPTAEGPALQEANIRALKNGATTDRMFALARELRRDVHTPMVFRTYANVVFSYGAQRFFSACREAGMDGLFVPDLPFEEKEEFAGLCREYGVDLLSVVAPTSKERVAMIAREAQGFLYIDMNLGGTKAQLQEMLRLARENTGIPCAVACAAPELAATADGVIDETGIVPILKQYGRSAPGQIGRYVQNRKTALQADA